MGTNQFDNGELDETLAEKNVHFESAVDQTVSKQRSMENGNGSEPEIYLLISHRGRKHDPRGGRRIGLFGPFGPRGPKDFGFPHGRPHPHERPRGSDARRGPPYAREFRRGSHFMHDPENEEFADERGYGPHRGMRRFGPGPHERRGPTLKPGSEFHHEPRHHGDSSRRPHGFGPREHGPRGGPHSRFETGERIHSPYHRHPSRENGHGPRGGPRGRFETEERARSPHHHLPREHGHGHHSREQGFGLRDKFEAEENVKRFHRGKLENHECNPQSHKRGHGPRGKSHDPRERFETEEFHGKHRRYGGLPFLGPHERGQHRRRNEHGSHSGSPSREHGHGPHGRFERESGYLSDHLEHHGPGFDLRGGRRFEHVRHGSELDCESDHSNGHRGSRTFEPDRPRSESEYESDRTNKSFEHRSGGRKFDHGRHRLDSRYSSEIFRNHRGGFDSRGRRGLSRNGSRLHRHVRGARHGIFRSHPFPHHSHHPHHLHKPLTPEELAEKVALLNSMGFTSENNSHYEELLRKFNGRVGSVVDILLREQKKEKGDESKEEDNEEEKDDEEEKRGENKEDYVIVVEADE